MRLQTLPPGLRARGPLTERTVDQSRPKVAPWPVGPNGAPNALPCFCSCILLHTRTPAVGYLQKCFAAFGVCVRFALLTEKTTISNRLK